VRVHYDEGIAIHIGPEPCGGTREGIGEASAGDRAGQPLSRESSVIPDADAFPTAEGNTDEGVSASPRTEVQDPGMYGRSLTGNREISRPAGNGRTGPHREGEEP
jgi:hypothetical protein